MGYQGAGTMPSCDPGRGLREAIQRGWLQRAAAMKPEGFLAQRQRRLPTSSMAFPFPHQRW